MSRGESVYLVETPAMYIAHVEEGLGTKILVADAMYRLIGRSFYDLIAQDTVAMIVNDIITLGAMPVSLAMHLAVGDSNWFKEKKRLEELIHGWGLACDFAGCSWSGGETSILKGIIMPETAVLSGSAVGVIEPKERLIKGNIQNGDAIVLIGSSGIHANGLTLACKLAEKLPKGYLTTLSNGRSYGETLLDPTLIYVRLIEKCLGKGFHIHYAVNITGHGWRKLMRAPLDFTYVVERIPNPKPVFQFIQEYGPVGDREMYATFNMGTGFALYVPENEVDPIGLIAKNLGLPVLYAGYIEKGERKVVIKPKRLEYTADTLRVR